MESITPPKEDNLIAGVIAGAAAGLIGVGVWMLFYRVGSYGFAILGWLSGPVIGLMIGLVIRKVGQSPRTPAGVAASVITLLSCAVGYIVTDIVLVPWQPPSDLPQAIRNFGGDIQAWVLILIGCYIAFVVARRSEGAL